MPAKRRGFMDEAKRGAPPAQSLALSAPAASWQEQHFKQSPRRSNLFTQDSPLLHSYASICTVTKDDNLDIVEWVEYHRRLGIDVIYVVDNGSEEPVFNSLLPYIKANFVVYTYLPWTPSRAQCFAYEFCLRTYGYRHRWMGFMDTDEFVVIPPSTEGDSEGDPTRSLMIGDVLRNYSDHDGLALNWREYSSSGHVKRPGSVLGHYHKCGKEGNQHVKIFVNPRKVARVRNPHFVTYHRGTSYTVNTQRKKVTFAFNVPPLLNVMYINHYVTKSIEDFHRKMTRGSAAGTHRTMAFFQAMETAHHDDCHVLQMPAGVGPFPPPALPIQQEQESSKVQSQSVPVGQGLNHTDSHQIIGMAVRFERELRQKMEIA